MCKKTDRGISWRLVGPLVAAMVAIVGVASAGASGRSGGLPASPGYCASCMRASEGGGRLDGGLALAGTLRGRLNPAAGRVGQAVEITDLSRELYVVDLAGIGVHPIPGEPPVGMNLEGGAVGLGGAYMSISPDVISQTVSAGFGAASANWQPGEMVAVSINGGAPTNYTASATGRLGQIFNVGSGLGFITIEARGLSSGRQTGGVVEVRDAAPPVPGLAVAPHAINPNGSSNINVLGTRYVASASVTLARNSTTIATLTSGGNGSFYYQINVAAGADTSATYSTYTSTAGSQVGQSIEERADAGVPPIGDQNVARAFIDRPAVASAGGTLAIVGEGFSPGETVSVSGCGSLSATADANGAVAFFNGISGSGLFQCVLSGGITGRVGRASGVAASNVINAPGIIAAPAAVGGTGTFRMVIDRLLPNQVGTVYVDGVSQGSLSTDAGGKAAALVNKPTSGFLHTVRWVGASGQSVAAPLLYLPAGGTPTPTRIATNTPVMTNTPSATGTMGASNTPTVTRTATACAVPFTDVQSTDYFYEGVRYLYCKGAISGYQGKLFLPYNNNTRGQLTKIVVLGYSFAIYTPPTPTFSDVPAVNPFYPYVETAYHLNLIAGYGCGTGCLEFRPNNLVTRGQLCKIVALAAGWELIHPTVPTFNDVPPTNAFYEHIETGYCHQMVSGYVCGSPGEPCPGLYFRPGANGTRGQICKIVYGAIQSHPCSPPESRSRP